MLFLRPAGFILFAALCASAQAPAFEVASIKPNASPDLRSIGYDMFPGGRFTATNMPLRLLISLAYNVPVNPSERISGLPEWVMQERYDIEAKAPEGAIPSGLSDVEYRAQMRKLLQGLLADASRRWYAMRRKKFPRTCCWWAKMDRK